jgi:hypothetical protein
LGLAVAWQRIQPQKHLWFVFESNSRRIEKSLSDLGGTDVHIHYGHPSGVFAELANAFVKLKSQPPVDWMRQVHITLRKALPKLLRDAGTVAF